MITTYRFPTYWITTDEIIHNYIEKFEVPEEFVEKIVEDGYLPTEVMDIIDPIE